METEVLEVQETQRFDLGEKLMEGEANNEDWIDPIPINKHSNLPEFPSEVLPEVGRKMVEAVAEVNQVPTGLPACVYLGVLSTSLAKKIEIDLITHSEPANIFTASILESGERKTSTLGIMTAPTYQYQKDKEKEMADEIREAYNKYKIHESRLATLQKKAANTNDIEERNKIILEAEEVARWLDGNPVPKAPTYIADDITPEATGDLMAENGEKLSIISAEGGTFGTMAGRYSDKNCNIDIFLKGHAGDPWSCHRMGRNSKTMESPSLTMCLAVQPDVIREIGRNKQFKGRGLLARFLYSSNTSKVGYRKRQKNKIPDSLISEYNQHIKELMDIPLELHTLKLTPEAQALWDEFSNDVEKEQRIGKSLESARDWGSKLAGAVARIAGLLHCAAHGRDAFNKDISVSIVGASCAIGGYFKEHALATFGLMQEDQKIEFAKKILEYVHTHESGTFKGRDVLRNKNALKSMDNVKQGLDVLTERGYIREILSDYKGSGRPEAITYEINPKIKTL